jgi:small neutral amino acid transporter SnatA (MarC family)
VAFKMRNCPVAHPLSSGPNALTIVISRAHLKLRIDLSSIMP